MPLIEVKAEIPPAAANLASDLLSEAALEQWSVLEDVIAKRAWIVGILASRAEAASGWADVETRLRNAAVEPLAPSVVRELPDADWRDSYKAHFHPWQFGRLHWVPTWERERYAIPPGHSVLWLDPGLAFGTGNHETTRLCVERLVTLAQEAGASAPLDSRRVIDAGCGSGILALSAALLGFGEIVGFDNDAEAVRISEENAALNHLPGRVHFFVGDLVSGLAEREADVVLANIQADVLMRFAGDLVSAVAPGGTLILSGILADENAKVREAFEPLVPSWSVNARTMGEWSDLVLTRPAAS